MFLLTCIMALAYPSNVVAFRSVLQEHLDLLSQSALAAMAEVQKHRATQLS